MSYLYEPDSFIPLARIESREGQAGYAADPVHLAHQEQWDLPGGKSDPVEQVRAWRAHQQTLQEARHQAFWTKRREIAEAAAGNDRIHYYHCDHLGTPLELLDERGQAVWAARYKAWGRIHRQEIREVEQPLRFQGQYEDEETELFYNRHRYYDPDAARYLTLDPIGLLGGLNGYAYAPNPTGWVDPLGLAKFGTGKGTHTATVSVTDKAGNTQPCGTFHSGNMTPEEKALGFPLSTLATHTEARATNDVPLRPGDTMRIEGQYPPCPSCRGKMNAKAKETGASIIYEWEENGQKKTWRTPKNPCE